MTSSGTLNPHFLIQVGTQVSGTIDKIFVDFNSKVRRGQLIALLDTTFLHATLDDALATLMKAQSQEVLTKKNSERTKVLLDKGLSAQADLDQAVADYEAAKAASKSAQSELDRAKINLAYAKIVSPISGVVVNRNVDVGPDRCRQLQHADAVHHRRRFVENAGSGKRRRGGHRRDQSGAERKFTVDAYPNRYFVGTISQIRLQPTTVQNVVTYTVMIDVDNPDLALMPGMTANITVAVQGVHNVLKVPSAALKFSPPASKAAAAPAAVPVCRQTILHQKTADGREALPIPLTRAFPALTAVRGATAIHRATGNGVTIITAIRPAAVSGNTAGLAIQRATDNCTAASGAIRPRPPAPSTPRGPAGAGAGYSFSSTISR